MSEQATWRAHWSLGRGGLRWQKGEYCIYTLRRLLKRENLNYALSETLEKVLWDCMFEVSYHAISADFLLPFLPGSALAVPRRGRRSKIP